MPASKLTRSNSDSWSMMPTTAQEGLTEASTVAAVPTPCETHDTSTSLLPTQAVVSPREAAEVDNDSEDTAEVMRDEEGKQSSLASDDSWVEMTQAELESLSDDPLATEERANAEAAAATEEAATAEPATHALLHTESATRHAHASAEPSATQLQMAAAKNEEDSATELRAVEGEATHPAPRTTEEPQSAPPASPKEREVDLAEFLARLTLTKAYGATAAAQEEDKVTGQEAAAQVIASFDAAEPTDDFTVLAAEEDQEMEETIDLENVPSSVPSARRGNKRLPINADGAAAAAAPSSTRAQVTPPPTGATEVLRRRMVATEWMRTLRGPSSELTPEERVEAFQALFGDPGDAPISAERFKEMMVPYERHCDCLGASYGFHHQACRFYEGSQLTS
ncbi:hypothetical protein ABB37_01819 [Leptomonas pyrrhocoris]|uniref:Uncharacterized protein n=1 Tax=Leptomonas pyrrhocoris TaxID=157538 RepID=A0A0M9G9Q2_LEPPY|nr:hypothetical protein ABB37_01819 [Leptomonas pyrrhocoris]KPA85549.1 hypothetical protein ABB37_01819 [Leptomonas pyrrhocoris]|eukprot:XP_015663988.1 hypothetical protein ABB37_01819 [Leptomonas pyrrhocoris]